MALIKTGAALRWSARGLSLAAVGLVLLFAFGEGLHLSRFTGRELALFVFFPFGACLGMIIAWRWEVAGGGLTVASLAGFYFIHWLMSSRFPHGWAFLLVASPGLLFLVSGTLAHRHDQRQRGP